MFSLIDQLYVGTLDFSCVNFSFDHINMRCLQNRLSLDYIKNLLFNEEMLDYCRSDKEKYPDSYKLFYPAPDLKEYEEVIICVSLFDDCVNVMTVYGNTDYYA